MTANTVPDAQAVTDSGPERDSGGNGLIDLLTGADLRDTGKNPLVQKVLRQLIETYGFDRNDIRTRPPADRAGQEAGRHRHCHPPQRPGGRGQRVERVIVCQPQKPREKLRGPQEAIADLRKLHDKLELVPGCHLGMWTNGHEEFFVRGEEPFEADGQKATLQDYRLNPALPGLLMLRRRSDEELVHPRPDLHGRRGSSPGSVAFTVRQHRGRTADVRSWSPPSRRGGQTT